jgi:hypothetical protein
MEQYSNTTLQPNPCELFTNLICIQRDKELLQDIWKDSPYKDLVKLQSNNAGVVGERFIQDICVQSGISANINGAKTRMVGGGYGDGKIKNKNVENRTSRMQF